VIRAHRTFAIGIAFVLPAIAATGSIESNIPFGPVPDLAGTPEPARLSVLAGALVSVAPDDPLALDGHDLVWNAPAGAGMVGLQYPFGPHVRLMVAGLLGDGLDVSAGLVFRVNGRPVVWEIETIQGVSRRTVSWDTTLADGQESTTQAPGSSWSAWGQFALRARVADGGPLLEFRVLPNFPLGRLFGSTSDRGTELSFVASTVGWVFPLSGGRQVLAAGRLVFDGQRTVEQALVQVHAPVRFGKGSRP